MNTPTIQDVNDIGCCCPFPECPGNRWKHWDRTLSDFEWTFVPFVRPEGDDEDDMPVVYDNEDVRDYYGELGAAAWYEGWNENPTVSGEWAELKQKVELDFTETGYDPSSPWGWPATATVTDTSNVSEDGPPGFADAEFGTDTFVITNPLTVYQVRFNHQFTTSSDWAYVLEDADATESVADESWDAEAALWTHNLETIRYYKAIPEPGLQGPGGATGLSFFWFDIAVYQREQILLLDPITETSYISTGIVTLSGIPLPGGFVETLPVSETIVYSRTEEEFENRDRWPWIGDANEWPEAPTYGIDDYLIDRPLEIRLSRYLLGLEYSVGIPADWETANAAWHAWNIADPETRGDEPAGKRSIFECQWQEVFFPQAWVKWEDDHDEWEGDHADWEEARDEWEETPEEERGPEPEEPEEPAKPTAEEDRPSLVQDREWTYGGPGTDAYSGRFDMPPPPAPGEVRPVNMLIVCYHSERVGVKPTAHGEIIDLENP